MKKNISINISGIIFHIEEDGYETLRKYLDSVNRYFSSFEDSTEILADIEGRMAEIFLSKLNESKQVITQEDVNALISIMGNVSDFKAAEENEFVGGENKNDTTGTGNSNTTTHSSTNQYNNKRTSQKRFVRDQQRKVLGGICAGIASYINVDVVWVRLFFALSLFAYGTPAVIYIILWIVVSGSFDVEEPEVTKKMYRDSENKVLGGVASGIAAYFSVDVTLARIFLFISFFFFGTGFLLYIVLWIVLPEAKTITDRMQMQGEPVTLSNIESTLKKNTVEEPNKEETLFTKILLLPFRIAADVITGVGKILRPILEVMRVAIGICIAFFALIFAFCLVLIGGIFAGIFSGFPKWIAVGDHTEIGLPLEAISNSFPATTVIMGFIALFIPIVIFILLGISIVAKRIVFNATVGWSLFVLFFVSVVILGLTVPRIVYSFKEQGEYIIENTYRSTGKTTVLTLREIGLDDYHAAHLTLKGYEEPVFKLTQRYQAQGSSRQKAIENAQMIDYTVDFRDSVFTFDSNVRFKPDSKFRVQELDMTLYIPYNTPFVMDKGMCRFITQYVDKEKIDNETWEMTRNGLRCTSCTDSETDQSISDKYWDFDQIQIVGLVEATIKQGDTYSVELTGSDEEKDRYTIRQRGSTLFIEMKDYNNTNDFNWEKGLTLFDEVELSITIPSLEKIEAKGAGKIHFIDLVCDGFEVELLGAFKAKGQITTHRLEANIKGASELELTGEANNLEATLAGASKLQAYNFPVENAVIEAVGLSRANVDVSEVLEIKEGAGSKIRYKGTPNKIKRN